MSGFNKKSLSERDVCTKLIAPAILKAGWTLDQFMEEVPLTAGRVMVRGQVAKRVTNPPPTPCRAEADCGQGGRTDGVVRPTGATGNASPGNNPKAVGSHRRRRDERGQPSNHLTAQTHPVIPLIL